MKIKTSELEGVALNWAVAKCERVKLHPIPQSGVMEIFFSEPDGCTTYQPTTDWAQAGPIIEREIVSLDREEGGKRWRALAWRSDRDLQSAFGPTLLVAAMRCYVASKLSEEVEIPDELITINDGE